MFKIDPAPTFAHTVSISKPGSDVPLRLPLVFKHKTKKQFDEWVASAAANDAEFLAEAIHGWGDEVQDAYGHPLVFCLETLALLLDAYPAAATEIYLAYRRQLHEARAKN